MGLRWRSIEISTKDHMKTKHAIILMMIGLCLDFLAVPLKIMHIGGSAGLFVAGSILKIVGGLIFLYKLLTYPKIRSFLNW